MLIVLLTHTTVLLLVTAQRNLTPFGTATQSSFYVDGEGGPKNAVDPPISNAWSINYCAHTDDIYHDPAWWMFQFSFGSAYITDVNIYYRENSERRMDGFKLYVTNTSTIPPDGFLCYADTAPGFPSITQTIACNQIGKYFIYYDDTGTLEWEGTKWIGPLIELCYIGINGCPKGMWGQNCSVECPSLCIDLHCHPENGSCIYGSPCRIDTNIDTSASTNCWMAIRCMTTNNDLKGIVILLVYFIEEIVIYSKASCIYCNTYSADD